jgi:hypothetical protein
VTDPPSTRERDRSAGDRREALLAEYAEINSNFRLLTNIRFKLLAFLPLAAAATVAVTAAVPDQPPARQVEGALTALSLFGFVVTAGLASYNARNDQVYLWLVTRAAAVERELGLFDGSFANRPNTGFGILIPIARRHGASWPGWVWPVGHVSSVGLIYSASLALWLAVCLASGVQLFRGSHPLTVWEYLTCIGLAILLTVVAGLHVRRQRLERREDVLGSAKEAVRLLLERPRSDVRVDDWPPGDREAFVQACMPLGGVDRSEGEREREIELRIAYYGGLPEEEWRRCIGPEPRGVNEADRRRIMARRYVGLIVDLPPWQLEETPSRR